MKRSFLSLTFACLLAALLVAQPASAQRDNSKARPSPNAKVSQTVGTTIIDMHYSRPGVKDREIFGGLEAWGKVWRAGANEPTTITISDDMMVEGQALPAGTYSFFLLPQEEGDWTAIFTEPVGWGTQYDESKDVLRVMVTPEEGEFEEWLSYSFENLSDDSATLVMKWDETVVPVQFTVAGDM
ncbi:MAG TPA: DUF2911 domain-containing protein [Rhodothermales bacterium]|nr:DUF2911 domain-containing protein [Rhodothermales bacterium]